jgi:hypothetical protein
MGSRPAYDSWIEISRIWKTEADILTPISNGTSGMAVPFTQKARECKQNTAIPVKAETPTLSLIT